MSTLCCFDEGILLVCRCGDALDCDTYQDNSCKGHLPYAAFAVWLDMFPPPQCMSRRGGDNGKAPPGAWKRHCCLLFYNAIIINYYNYLLYNSFYQLPLLLRSPSPLCYLFDLQGVFGEVRECLSFFVGLLYRAFCVISFPYFFFCSFFLKTPFEVCMVLVYDKSQPIVALKGPWSRK